MRLLFGLDMRKAIINTAVSACLSLAAPNVFSHEPVTEARTPINIPSPAGLVTLKCDFHIHTVFSDGLVWPSVRAQEAWREGLDAIAITDHIEYQPHKADVSTNHNRAYEIAQKSGAELDLLVIRGSEITRKMPPGHLNAIFLTNAAALAVSNWQDAVTAALGQGAFIFWNHPGWEAQITNGIVRWYAEHTQLLEQGALHGIEVVNGREYYPEAHRWAIEKKLTMLSNSDIHSPLNMDYHTHAGDRRPLTLVFARERSAAALQEALQKRRTAVYADGRLIGEEQYLAPIFAQSLEIKNRQITLKGKQQVLVQIANHSSLDYELALAAELEQVKIPKKLVLAGGKTVLLRIAGKDASLKGARKLSLPYMVKNLLIGPEKYLPANLEFDITFVPTPAK